jgi:multidrug efflux pump
MGVAVFAGMLGVTFFGLVLTPVFYVLVRGVGLRRQRVVVPQTAPAVLAPEGLGGIR